jgi:hypothetical protein
MDMKVNPALSWQKQHSKKDIFPNKFELGLKKILVKCFIWIRACMVMKLLHSGKQNVNIWEVSKCDVGRR